MRIELVGGPKCGEIVPVVDFMPVVALWDGNGGAVKYVRRDRSYSSIDKAGAIFGTGGLRMYDYVKPDVPSKKE